MGGGSQKEEKGERVENVPNKIMAENFPSLKKETYPGTRNTEGLK